MPSPVSSLSRPLLAAAILATLLAGAIAALGMLASFHTVSTEMQPTFGHAWAWTVPATLDLTVAAFSLLEIVLLRLRLPHLLARLTVYAATTATIYLNTRAATGRGHAQLLAHAAMPAVWVLYIELLRSAAATLTRREHPALEHPVLALILAPWPTITAWRSGVLTRTVPPQHRDASGPKASTASGHFPDRCLQQDTMRRGTDMHREQVPNPAERPSQVPAQEVSLATAAALRPAPTDHPTPKPIYIGKGRGRTSRHAVQDLVHRHPELTTQQIAARLNLSTRTVRRHLSRR